jgi:serine protease AprX
MTDRRVLVALALACLMLPATGSIAPMAIEPVHIGEGQLLLPGQVRDVPHGVEGPSLMAQAPWWTRTTLDLDRNGIHDALEAQVGPVWVGLSYGTSVAPSHLEALADLGLEPVTVVPAVDALLLGQVDASLLTVLSSLDDVVMVEAYGQLVFWGDVQTPAVKARSSSVYPDGAWDLGVSGDGIVIAMVDTGVDDEHPGLDGKFVAGYDAVCYLHSDPECVLAGGRVTDGSFNPDDGNQHGTACMGMASATGLDASGAQTNFTGSAPDAALVDVRIGTDAGAGPFENYLLSQEFYESAMNGLQWIIDHKDDAWAGADEDDHGIDIISLSWGITSHEGGGSDGEDMHSRILNEAMEAGIVVSVAAGNDGPSNDGLSGMGSSSLSITVGATDDKNTIDRTDDTVAGYSSRGPRRDNGDGNPLDELKPEVSAPGTNIVQAEGCITQGGCNNFLGGDASENGYTNRGSGTSYATPSVSGIIALMLEANPELSTAEVKEILKFTAERRGEPSAPDVDPFWNRDFGWGIVDARAAVEMAIDLAEQGSTGLIDVSAQAHLLNISSSNGIVTLTGVAWAQGAPLLAVEYRVDDGAWRSATFDAVPGDLSSLERFNWTVALATDAFGEGGHEVEVRAVTQNGLSLSSFATFSGTVSDQGESGLSHLAVMILILAMVLTGTAAVRGASERPFILTEADVEREPLDATLVEDVGSEDESAGPPPS